MAKLLAESPSVKIKVHLSEFLVPAKLASSNFSIPNNLTDFLVLLFNFFNAFSSSLVLAYLKHLSIIPEFVICFKNFSLNSNELPNSFIFIVKVYFVCELKAGFSIKLLTKIHVV